MMRSGKFGGAALRTFVRSTVRQASSDMSKGYAALNRKYHCHRHSDSNEKQDAPKNNFNEPPCRRVVHFEPPHSAPKDKI
jgi:hypothetical protein